jgi:predicted MFS family arabinose efflux permease
MPFDERRLARRLAPLFVAISLQGLLLWLPIEKLFLTDIGFTPISIGVMAAAYSAVVPLLEIPSGVLADRWSRTGLLMLSVAALFAGTAIEGLSHNVATYIGGATLLGVYFALGSGTVESMVYDTVMEETGRSELFETWLGRVRAAESIALVASALAGGILAAHTSTRFTYFATLPLVAGSVLAIACFREPQLHKATDRVPLREHLTLALTAITHHRRVAHVALVSALVTMLASAIYEFGPLWLVAMQAPMSWYGPYSAAIFGMVAVGGLATGWLAGSPRATLLAVAVLTPAAAATLALTEHLALLVIAQVAIAFALVVTEVRAGQLLHDAVASHIRTGVASGVSTLSWILFVPLAIGFGWVARNFGIHAGGWILTGIAVVLAALVTGLALRNDREVLE